MLVEPLSVPLKACFTSVPHGAVVGYHVVDANNKHLIFCWNLRWLLGHTISEHKLTAVCNIDTTYNYVRKRRVLTIYQALLMT